ncbi:MAG: hypothetical protein H6807_00090 [Planctomycetes bacterium]|nr:hypothetical protein [Planctomycetota bacterium]
MSVEPKDIPDRQSGGEGAGYVLEDEEFLAGLGLAAGQAVVTLGELVGDRPEVECAWATVRDETRLSLAGGAQRRSFSFRGVANGEVSFLSSPGFLSSLAPTPVEAHRLTDHVVESFLEVLSRLLGGPLELAELAEDGAPIGDGRFRCLPLAKLVHQEGLAELVVRFDDEDDLRPRLASAVRRLF